MNNERSESKTISPERIRQARELRGKTQSELAVIAGTNQSTIANIENGRLVPSDELLDAIAMCLGFPPAFFRQEPPIDFPLGSLILYRAKASMTAREEARAHRYAQIAFEMASKLAGQLKMPPMRLPEVTDGPEVAAEVARSALGLSPDTPTLNLIRSIERAGVVVLALPISLADEEIDAFSLWGGAAQSKPIIALVNMQVGDRLRTSVAHELGHLVMHRSIRGTMTDIEQEAKRFAGAFLLPETVMRDEIATPVTLTSLAALKPRWGVSIQALIMRASELGIVTERQKKYLFTRLTILGWRKREPQHLDIPVEEPRGLCQMVDMLYGTPPSFNRMARDLRLPTALIKELLERRAMTPTVVSKGNLVRFSAGNRA